MNRSISSAFRKLALGIAQKSSQIRNQDGSLYAIISVVLSLHFILIGYALWNGPSEQVIKSPPPPRFVVQTVDIGPPPKLVAADIPEKSIEPTPEPEPEPEVPLEPTPKPEPELAPELIAEPTPPKPEPIPTPPPPKPEQKPTPKKVPQEKPLPKKAEPPKAQVKKPIPPKKPTPPPPPKPKQETKKNTPSPNAAQEKKLKEEADTQKKKDAELKKKKEADLQAEKARQQKLLATAQERIAKIDKNRDKFSPGQLSSIDLGKTPTKITSLQIDALPSLQGGPQLNDREVSYRDEVASRLKLLLKLPEYGDVKVKLTLDRSGKVVSVVIVSAESGANRKYIEKALPTMSFPAFGSNFDAAKEYTFSITLSNEL